MPELVGDGRLAELVEIVGERMDCGEVLIVGLQHGRHFGYWNS
jgi:hypothetical protein